MALPFDSLAHPLVIAHRGSMLLGPENTIYTFALAADAGADVLEMDVHPSSDGKIMVIHDSTLERTSNGSGPVGAKTLDELRRLDFAWSFSPDGATYPLRGQGITIPTLDEVFARFPSFSFSIDIKEDDPAFATQVVALVESLGMRDRVVLGSFHARIAAQLRRVVPALHIAADRAQGVRLLLSSYLPQPLATALLSGRALPGAYMLPDRLGNLSVATATLIRRIHRAGRRGYFWTVDSEEAMRRILRNGADGIVTNRPDLLYAVRGDLLRSGAAV